MRSSPTRQAWRENAAPSLAAPTSVAHRGRRRLERSALRRGLNNGGADGGHARVRQRLAVLA